MLSDFQKNLDRFLTTPPKDDSWWYEQASEYLDIITVAEWEKREAEFEGFLEQQIIAGLNPPKGAFELVKQLLPEKFAEYQKNYPLRVPAFGEKWQWRTASLGLVSYIIVSYSEEFDRITLRLTSEEEKRIQGAYLTRRPTLARLYKDFVQVIEKES